MYCSRSRWLRLHRTANRWQIWLATFRRALADNLPGLIFTFTPENSVPHRFIDELFAEVSVAGGAVIAVELTAPESAIEARMANRSHVENGKLTDLALYRQLRDAGVFKTPVIPTPRLRLDTGKLTSAQSAEHIMALLNSSPHKR